MSVKANKDKDSILADTKELLKILIPAIQTMPKIERIDGAAIDMKRAAFDMILHALSLIPKLRERFAAKGIRLNSRKFYDQPCEHGLEFLGSHIRPNRLHLNNKTFERGLQRIADLNKIKDNERYIDAFVCSINSYTGMLKNRTDYRKLITFIQQIDNSWWVYTYWNCQRQCVSVYKKYCESERLNRKYKLHLKLN